MKRPSVCAIIVNWNGKNDTLSCLASLAPACRKYPACTVMVVDNGSSDGSVESIRKHYPAVRILPLPQNIGFAGANNAGIREAGKMDADLVWFLNNDTTVDPDVLTLVDAFEDREVGAAGSKIYFSKGYEFHKDRYTASQRGNVIWYAGGIIDWNNMLSFHRGVDEVDAGQFNAPVETQYITGCSFMVRRSVLEEVGMFDESYFMYMEDLDLSLRIERTGRKLLYYPRSVVYHKNASSSGGSGSAFHEYYQTRNRLKIGFRYAPVRTKWALTREAVRMVLSGSGIKRQAVMDALAGRFGKRI